MKPDDSSREQMHEVLAAAERAATLTKQLLLFSRKQAVEVKPVDVKGIISGIQKMLSRVIGEDIDLQIHFADGHLTVMADTGQIEQVLMNLATNARDGMPKGGCLMITTETGQMDEAYVASHGYGHPGAYAVITVSDTGKGMDAEMQTKIFEPFFTTKGISEGTGLGLAISYGIIKQHDGYIKCYSELDKGTVFKIYLPLIKDAAASVIQVEVPGAIQGGTETILVAEDDPTLRKMTRVVMESFGYSVIMAVDGEDAVVKFMENRDTIRLVILDLIMPKKSGKEAYEAIKKANPGIRTIFLSGYTMETIDRMEIEEGMELIHKPFVPKDLLRKVREVLDR
jgi:CheY-like chemotaxis protein